MATNAVQLDVEQFCATFLPSLGRPTRLRSARRNPFSPLNDADELSAGELSRRLVDSVNNTNLISCSTLSFFEPPESSSIENREEKPYTAIFRGRYTSRSRRRPSWTDQAISVEVKGHTAGIDPFEPTYPENDYVATERERQHLFHQITATARLLFAAQHRTFLFMLLVIGRRCRLLRWDHAGIIATPSIDYFEQSAILCDLLWRLSHLDDTALGFDPTATRVLAGKADYLLMDAAALQDQSATDDRERDDSGFASHNGAAFEYAHSQFRASLADNWPRYKLEVPHGSEFRQYLVGKPTFLSEGVVGRGTRGYVALDYTHGRFVWLKDTWRASYLLADKEGDILQRLNNVGIENVPTLVSHGDIVDQITFTIEISARLSSARLLPHQSAPSSPASRESTTSAPSTIRKRKRVDDVVGGHQISQENTHADGPQRRRHTHYRIVMEEVCIPLKKFENSRQLVSVVSDCLRAHFQVASNPKTRLLHRDISMGNMLMFPKNGQDSPSSIVWTGVLSDWEMSKPIDHPQAASNTPQGDQIGTYQFMSVNSLQRPSQPIAVADELESFFHVLLYFAVRFLRSTCDKPSAWIDNYFHNYSGPQHTHACGHKSITIEVTGQLRTLSPLKQLRFNSPLDTIFSKMLPCFKARYKVLNHELELAATPLPSVSAAPHPPAPAPASPPGWRSILAQRRRPLTDEDLAVRAQIQAEFDNRAPPDNTPTAQERELASKVADHNFMLELLERVLREGDWPADDRIPAAQPLAVGTADAPEPPGPSPEHDVEPMPPKKRQRTVRNAASRVLVLATRSSTVNTTTRRTRSQARVAPVKTRSKR